MKFPLTIKLASWLIIGILGIVILIYAKDFLLPLVVAALLALLLYPVYNKLTKWKVPDLLAGIITVLLVIIIIVGVILLVSKQISGMVSDSGNLVGKMNDKLNQFQNYIKLHAGSDIFTNWLGTLKNKLLEYSGGMVGVTITGTTGLLSGLVLVIVYVFCFLHYQLIFKKFAFTLMSHERQDQAMSIVENVQKLVQNYLLGLITVIMIIGIFNTIGLLLLGIDHAIFFAFLTAFLTVIPYIGISIGALLTAIYAFLTKDTPLPALGVVLVLLFIQFLESNFITPRIVGRRVSVNPFVAIVVLLIGQQIWGVAGMILSVPITAILKVFLDANPSTQAIGYFLGTELTNKNHGGGGGKKQSS